VAVVEVWLGETGQSGFFQIVRATFDCLSKSADGSSPRPWRTVTSYTAQIPGLCDHICRIRTPEVSPNWLTRLSKSCPRSPYYGCKRHEALPRFSGIPRTLTSGGSYMYGDDDSWRVKCPSCGHGFTETIGRIKSRLVFCCPRCSIDFVHSRKQFLFRLSEARGVDIIPGGKSSRPASPLPRITTASARSGAQPNPTKFRVNVPPSENTCS
jgi:hypothetical protein